MTISEAEALPDPWQDLPAVKDRLSKGQRLLIPASGLVSRTVNASMANIGLNAEILQPLAELKRDRFRRLSAFEIEVYAVLLQKFYEKHEEAYVGRESIKNFDAKSWAWEQAWSLHKMFSKLRSKVQRLEMPSAPWWDLVQFGVTNAV